MWEDAGTRLGTWRSGPAVDYLGCVSGSHTGPGPLVGRKRRWLNQRIADQSHLSASLGNMPSFVDLPHRFTELYAMVSSGAADSADEATNSGAAEPTDDPAICLITGRVLAAGHKPAGNHNPGECTLHARSLGSGVGVFFLLQKCVVLLIRDRHAAYYPSIYVDSYGEEDAGLRRGKPLFLSTQRFAELQALYTSHRIAAEVAKVRSNADRVIKENYY
mmetsp:Transcript_11561/g.31157  ORF Transcript_11561/g.31157 Transcript_11561/m.31157 type:complete len:218 (-) Transcript_11561:369-1022(-)